MGKTYKKQPRRFDDDYHSKRSGSHRHVSGKRTGGMPILNNVDEDDFDDDYFDDEVEITDEIYIEYDK